MRMITVILCVVLLLSCLLSGCNSADYDPGPPYVISNDSIFGICEMFQLAERDDPAFKDYIHEINASNEISSAQKALKLKSYIENFYIPFVADMGGFEHLKTTIQYRSSDFSDVSLFCAYSDVNSETARVQWIVEQGSIDWTWEFGKVLSYTWKVNEHTVKVFNTNAFPHFDLIAICQFDDHYLMFRFNSEDIRTVKEQLRFVQFGEIMNDKMINN